jgi:hypothetical protein
MLQYNVANLGSYSWIGPRAIAKKVLVSGKSVLECGNH